MEGVARVVIRINHRHLGANYKTRVIYHTERFFVNLVVFVCPPFKLIEIYFGDFRHLIRGGECEDTKVNPFRLT